MTNYRKSMRVYHRLWKRPYSAYYTAAKPEYYYYDPKGYRDSYRESFEHIQTEVKNILNNL